MRSGLIVLALVLPAACRDAPAPPPRPTTLASYPSAMLRLARLMREEFSAADPGPVEQRIRCESERVRKVLGPDFQRRVQTLQDSLRSEFSAAQFDALGQRLAHLPAPSGYDPLCRSLEADAEREAPLAASSGEAGGGGTPPSGVDHPPQ